MQDVPCSAKNCFEIIVQSFILERCIYERVIQYVPCIFLFFFFIDTLIIITPITLFFGLVYFLFEKKLN